MQNPETFISLTNEEQRAIEKISAHSRVGEEEVRKVFRSLFHYTSREIIEGNNSIRIPYFMKIDFEYKIHEVSGIYKLIEKFKVTPTEPLHEVIINTHNGKKSWLHSFLVASMRKSVNQFLPSKNKIVYAEEEPVQYNQAV